ESASFSTISDIYGTMHGTVEGTATIGVGSNGHKYWDLSGSSNAINLGQSFNPTPNVDAFTILVVLSELKPTTGTLISKANNGVSARQFHLFNTNQDFDWFGYVGSSSQVNTMSNR